MWTSAASLPSRLQSVRDSLYGTTKRLLTSLEANDSVNPSIEHVQARILLLIYDYMQSTHNRGWLSAGQCLRLTQLRRLFETDTISQGHRPNSAGSIDWIIVEEQRRAFWVAFCLHVVISTRQESPLTLHEHTVGIGGGSGSVRPNTNASCRKAHVSLCRKIASKITNTSRWGI